MYIYVFMFKMWKFLVCYENLGKICVWFNGNIVYIFSVKWFGEGLILLIFVFIIYSCVGIIVNEGIVYDK